MEGMREEIERLKNWTPDAHIWKDIVIADKIIQIIQSHLVKEIESKKIKNDIEPKGGNWSTQDVINLQNTLIEDIIKIINNITSQNERN